MARNFTAQEQVAGYRWLNMQNPELAAKGIQNPETLAAWIDACEDVICLDLVDALVPVSWDRRSPQS